MAVVMDFASSRYIIQHAFYKRQDAFARSLAARSFVESLIQGRKGIGHLVDFILDG